MVSEVTKLFLVVLTLLLASNVTCWDDYCKPEFYCSSRKAKNTVCEYGCKPGKGVIPIAPNFFLRNNSLYWHNYYRNEVAMGRVTEGGNSAASNMNALSYDMGLEFTVLCWLLHIGVMEHDKCRITKKFKHAGQNLWHGGAKDPSPSGRKRDRPFLNESIKNFIWEWWIEYKDTTKDRIDKFEGMQNVKIGHFTQLAWADLTHVGCAYCNIRGSKTHYLAGCNYGPGGNKLGHPVYKRGDAATECPAGKTKNKQFEGLCGEIEEFTKQEKQSGNAEWEAWMKKSGFSFKYGKAKAHCVLLDFHNLLFLNLFELTMSYVIYATNY